MTQSRFMSFLVLGVIATLLSYYYVCMTLKFQFRAGWQREIKEKMFILIFHGPFIYNYDDSDDGKIVVA